VVLASERANALPNSLGASVQHRLVLRQADEGGYMSLDVPKDVLSQDSPPGRAVFAGQSNELQVAVPAGSTSPAEQAEAIDQVAQALTDQGVGQAAAIQRLASYITMADVPASVGGLPVLGINDFDLAPLGFPGQGAFLLGGMPGSGRTTALKTILQSLDRWQPGLPRYYFGPKRSVIHTEGDWAAKALDFDAMKQLAGDLIEVFELPSTSETVPGAVLVIEAIGEIVNGPSDAAVLKLVKLARRNGHLVVAEHETTGWNSSWPLLTEIKNNRCGLLMQPDQAEGDTLFKVPFPRVKRAEYPPGRGVFASSGKCWTVQLPFPAGAGQLGGV